MPEKLKRTIILNKTEFVLGEQYKDTVVDVSGTAIAGASYLTGCDQIQLASKDTNGMPFDHWVDVTRLKGAKTPAGAGGPAPVIPSRAPHG